ncbi:methyltransferase [Phlyctema vagabunda]|uniref:Methyltransferase n=1 Tax=Phlyctema vagabunda TaxID=108571 RepID=A0ABR4PN92_9HELO
MASYNITAETQSEAAIERAKVPHPSKKTVEESYDKIARTYLEWTSSFPSPRVTYLRKLISLLPPTAQNNFLELGCGAGVPCTQILAQHGSIIAVDVSTAQLEMARANVPGPGVEFQKADMGDLEFQDGSFDAVAGFYSLIHLPRSEQTILIKRIFRWLKPGGYMLANFATNGIEESWGGDWLGSEMFWSGWDVKGNIEMIQSAGFEVSIGNVEIENEGTKDVEFLWVIARR